jgi:hypothetical protein
MFEQRKSDTCSFIRSKQKYGIISQNIMRNPYITPTAKALYGYLAGFAGAENTAFPGRDLVCHEMGINKNTFTKYLWELQCWQIVQKERTRGGKGRGKGRFENNVYILDHYPPYVMMERKDFEESVWPNLHEDILGKKKMNADITASSPCTKISDMDKINSPCTKIPDMVKPDLVEPDPVISDTNNNSINNNRFKNNNINNNNKKEVTRELSPDNKNRSVVVGSSLSSESKEDGPLCTEPDQKRISNVECIFADQGILGLSRNTLIDLTRYSQDQLMKIAQVLRQKKEKGQVLNPSGLLASCPGVTDAILRGDFYPKFQSAPKTKEASEYEIYVPPGTR